MYTEKELTRLTINLARGILVDEEDYIYLTKKLYYISSTGYPMTRQKVGFGKYVIIGLHRYIMGEIEDRKILIDHIDGNPINNKRSNLRFCTPQENVRNRGLAKNNTSGFKGVTKECHSSRHKNRWRAEIWINYKKRIIGRFATPEEASQAYQKVARAEFGDFYREK